MTCFVLLAVLVHQTSDPIGSKQVPHEQLGGIEQDGQGIAVG
jgi:hypothetical protein